MHPDQEFSENQGPPWTPLVWSKSPEQLVAMAQQDLFATRADVETGALGTSKSSMSGQQTAPANESERFITPTPTSLNDHWKHALNDLRATEPLYGRSGEVDGAHETANPNA